MVHVTFLSGDWNELITAICDLQETGFKNNNCMEIAGREFSFILKYLFVLLMYLNNYTFIVQMY